MQWLLLAQAASEGLFGPNCNVPYLYGKSVDYQCRYDLEGLYGGKRSLWHLLVDCFSIGGTEDYTRNLYSSSWRCPQVITMTIGKVIPDGTWLGAYVANRAQRKRTRPGGRLEKPSDHCKAKDHEVNRYLQMQTGPVGQQRPVGNVYVKNPAALRKKPG